MGNFSAKVDKFIEIFIDQNGYVKVVQGLQNTVLIAIVGLVIGILIGTVIATARVLPKYKVLPRVLNGICSVYVAMFRGTPMVVQLLVFYYVLLPIIGWNITGVGRDACVRIEQRRIYFGNYAKRNPIGRRRTDGSGTCSRIKFRGEYDEDCHSAGCQEYSSDSRKRIYRAYQRNIGCKFRRRGGSVCGV